MIAQFVSSRQRVLWLSAIFVSLISASASASSIFVITEPDGSIRFTNREPARGEKAEIFTVKRGSFSFYSFKGGVFRWDGTGVRDFLEKHGEAIKAAAVRYGISEHLIKAVIHAESAFNRFAVSPKGAQGLMQLMPGTARMLGVRNPFEVEENIHGGSRHLASLLRKYDGNLALALAAYNAGEGAVDKFGGIPPYSETRDYVRRVLSLKDRYRANAATG